MKNSGLLRLMKDLRSTSGVADPCPPDEALVEFVLDSVEASQARTVSEHIAGCSDCAAQVAELRESLSWYMSREHKLDLGADLGRAVKLSELSDKLKASAAELFAKLVMQAKLSAGPQLAVSHRSGGVMEAELLDAGGKVQRPAVRFSAKQHRIGADGALSFEVKTEDGRVTGRMVPGHVLRLELKMDDGTISIGEAVIREDGQASIRARLGHPVELGGARFEPVPLKAFNAYVLPTGN